MKALSNIWRTVALSACTAVVVSGMIACSVEDSIVKEEQTPAAQQEGLKVTFTATFDDGAATRGVSFGNDGMSSTSTFADGDKIYVYNVTKSALEPNRLSITGISADGKSATFTGTLSGTYAAGDALKLYYNMSDFIGSDYEACEFEYAWVLDGSATTASACDYAMADAEVGTISGGTLTLASAVTLTKLQSVFRQRLTFKKGNDTVTPTITSLIISSASNKLSMRYWVGESLDVKGPVAIANPTIDANGDIYLALRFLDGSNSNDALTLTATDSEGNQYTVTKNAPSDGFKNGKYYYGAMTLTQTATLIRPTITRSDGGTVPEPDENNSYRMAPTNYSNGVTHMTISGTSKGYWFQLLGNTEKTVTLNNLNATYDESSQFIFSGTDVTISLSGANSITCKNWYQCISANVNESNLKLSGKGTLTVTVNSTTRYGLLAKNYYENSSQNVSDLAADGYTVIRSEMKNNGNGTYTWKYSVRPTADPVTGHALSASAVGEVVGTDGLAYAADDKDFLPTGVTAAGMVAYKSGTSGLVIALADEASTMEWSTANGASGAASHTPTVSGQTWKLPSLDEWKQMFSANGGDESYYSGLNTAITNAGGTTLEDYGWYWSSTESGDKASFMDLRGGYAFFYTSAKDSWCKVRACLAF